MMKKMGKAFLMGMLLFPAVVWAQISPEAAARAAALVRQMTLEEKIDYIGGYNHFYIRGIPRLGVPEIRMADGPQGVRNKTRSTMYPCGIAAAASWSREAVYEMGVGLGRDARARGVHILLGPGVNIYRSPLCGRNFEYFGEDPLLASETAVCYIRGVQSQGVMATIKHFAGNNQEYDRHHTGSDIDERTLHEIYLPAFRRAVREAGVGAVMSSYNMLNGVHASENRILQVDILRDKWDFEGILMSDWNSTYSAAGAANNGLDLEMPSGRFMNREQLMPLIASGVVSERTIDLKVQHILQTLITFGFFDRHQQDRTIAENDAVSRLAALRLARESAVLLKNDGNILPLRGGNILVMGPCADTIYTGGGSGAVHPFHTVSVVEGMKKMGRRYKVNSDEINLCRDLSCGEYYADPHNRDMGLLKEYDLAVRKADAVILCMGFNSKTEKEDADRSFSLPEGQERLITDVAKLNQHVIVVINSGGGVEMQPWLGKIQGLLMAWYPGQEGGLALAEILTGRISPSGKLPVSIERCWEDNPVAGSYYPNLPDGLYRKQTTRRVNYNEGVFIGYRGYDCNGTTPLFPFGFGLSYTTFTYSDLKVKTDADSVRVSFEVRNTGKCDGAEVAQVYVSDVACSVPRPERELKGYEKLFLKAGEQRQVNIVLDRDAFAFYDIQTGDFVTEPGTFVISAGSSSADLPLKQTITF